jgi:hypothetical protein
MIAKALLVTAALALSAPPAGAARPHRLPTGFKWGRCLLVVDGETRIDGRCSYRIAQGGEFWIHGPRQVFGGIDYPKPDGGAAERSQDYWAYVFRDEGMWSGYGNSLISSVHGDPAWGPLHREGACFVGPTVFGEADPGAQDRTVRVCLWRH